MMACAFVPLIPKELIPAILGRFEQAMELSERGIWAGIESSDI